MDPEDEPTKANKMFPPYRKKVIQLLIDSFLKGSIVPMGYLIQEHHVSTPTAEMKNSREHEKS